MKNFKKGFTLTVSIIIVFVVLMLIGGFYFWNKNKNKDNNIKTPVVDLPPNIQPSETKPDVKKMIGFASSQNGCLIIKNDSLKEGEKVIIVNEESQEVIILESIIEGLLSEDNCLKTFETPGQQIYEDGLSFYQISSKDNKERIFPSLAVIADSLKYRKEGDFLTIDVDSDDKYEFINYCTTGEGINSFVWSGEPWKSEKLWSYYYYLGYDVEPNCPEENISDLDS